MLSLEKCDKILNADEKKYTVDEIKQVREILCKLANLEKEIYLNKSNEECNNLHESLN
jgi:hypothetical protein